MRPNGVRKELWWDLPHVAILATIAVGQKLVIKSGTTFEGF
jgi:hypothetical protein